MGKRGTQGGSPNIRQCYDRVSASGVQRCLAGNPYRVGPVAASWYIATVHIETSSSDASQGLERAVYTTKSFLIGLALIKGRVSVEQAAQAAHVEVNSQIERWGEVEDCTSSRLTRSGIFR